MTQTPLTTRRSIVTGSAWAIPTIVVASAAPVRAASICAATTLTTNFNSPAWTYSTAADQRSATGTYTWMNPTGDGRDFTMTISVTGRGTNTTMRTNTLSPIGPNTGGLNASGVRLPIANSNAGIEEGLDVSISFTADGAPTTADDFAMTVTDVDGSRNTAAPDGFGSERVALLDQANFATTITNPSYVVGSGTIADPWRATTQGNPRNPNNNTGSKGNVSISAVTPPSSVNLAFGLAQQSNNSGRAIFLADMSFTATCQD